jgi:predicted ATPase
MSNYSDAIKEAFAIAPASKVVLHTLEISQEGVQPAFYIVKARRNWVARDESGVERTFIPVNFDFSLPAATEEGFQSLTLTVDNINRIASDFAETAKDTEVPVLVTYRPYLSDDSSQPQMIPPLVMFFDDVQITEMEVSGRATFMDIVNKKFPSEIYTRERFPSLG